MTFYFDIRMNTVHVCTVRVLSVCVCERRPKRGKERCKRNQTQREEKNRMFGCLLYFLLHSSYLMGLNGWTIYKGYCCSNLLLLLYDCCCHCHRYKILSLCHCHCNQKVKYTLGEREREREIALARITDGNNLYLFHGLLLFPILLLVCCIR